MTDRELKEALRDKILRRMKELKMSHKEVAYILGIRPASLSRMLAADNNMTVFSLHRLEQALQITLLNLQ
jgi:predicted transcriptional regulator